MIRRALLAGLAAGLFVFAPPAYGRDARTIGDWLCGRIFAGDGATLAMTCDGFFAMRLLGKNTPPQNMTGLWRLDADGVNLTLYNRQDSEIHMTVGQNSLHASLGGKIQAELAPSPENRAKFRVTGLFERRGKTETLTDASSGRIFPAHAPEAAHDKFATFELIIDKSGAHVGKAIRHSGSVPRFFARGAASTGFDAFSKEVAGRFWLLPPLPAVPKAALRLAPPVMDKDGPGGSFEIAGPGLRYEGNYSLDNDKLTFKPERASRRNIKLMGAGELAEIFQGALLWQVTPRGLEIVGARKLLLLPVSP